MKDNLFILCKKLYRKNPRDFVVTLLLMTLSSLLQGVSILMLVPILSIINIGGDNVLSNIFAGLPFAFRILILLVIFFLVMTLQAVTGKIVKVRSVSIAANYTVSLREDYYEKLMKTDWQAYIGTKQSAHMDTIVNEIPRLTSAISYLMNMISNIATAVVELVIAFSLSLPLSLVVIIIGAGFFLTFRKFTRRSRALGEELTEKYMNFTEEIKTQLAGFKEIRSYGVEKSEEARFDSAVRALMDNLVNATDNSTRPRMYSVIGEAVLICIIFFIAEVLLHVETANLIVVLYVFSRLWPLLPQLQENIQVIRESMPAYDLLNLGDEEQGSGDEERGSGRRERGSGSRKQDSGERKQGSGSREQGSGDKKQGSGDKEQGSGAKKQCSGVTEQRSGNRAHCSKNAEQCNRAEVKESGSAASQYLVKFRNVTFSYKDAPEPALSGASFYIRKNTITAFTGPSGAGKSTVVDLLLGFLEPSEGAVDIRLSGKKIAYVPQNPMIVSADIRENIARFHPGISDAEIIEALKKSGAWDFLVKKNEERLAAAKAAGVRQPDGSRQAAGSQGADGVKTLEGSRQAAGSQGADGVKTLEGSRQAAGSQGADGVKTLEGSRQAAGSQVVAGQKPVNSGEANLTPLDIRMGDDGAMFSGGEAQRIVLARALAGNPGLLILDEATSALDFENERRIFETLSGLRQEMTIILIAHRITTIRDADDIIVIKDGRVSEEGTYEELSRNPQSYLSKMQEG